jgi:hypothetical protein
MSYRNRTRPFAAGRNSGQIWYAVESPRHDHQTQQASQESDFHNFGEYLHARLTSGAIERLSSSNSFCSNRALLPVETHCFIAGAHIAYQNPTYRDSDTPDNCIPANEIWKGSTDSDDLPLINQHFPKSIMIESSALHDLCRLCTRWCVSSVSPL